ncbi:MAG: ATP-binding protein [Nitrososphaerales archaeon]|jgi:predicted kinase
MKNKLIVMVGLPRSGKTTRARQLGFPIVNPDSIRLALHGNRLAEPFVWEINYLMIRALFLAGHDTVIVDAAHTTNKRRDPYFDQFGNDCHIEFMHIDTSKEICIERATKEGDTVIIPIIEKMANQFESI